MDEWIYSTNVSLIAIINLSPNFSKGKAVAKIEITHPASEHYPASTEVIEARVWALGGREDHPFYIGSGANFQANGTLWLEISYSIEGAQIFYTRNFLQHEAYSGGAGELENQLDEMVRDGEGKFVLGDMLPETSLAFIITKSSYQPEDGEEEYYTRCSLKISTDTGTVFGRSGPGMRSIDIELHTIEKEQGICFMRELIHEIDAVQKGKYPDPANFPPGSSEWPLIGQLNRQAYNQISKDYQEDYFENPLLTAAFDGWLAQLGPGAHVLDAGCGHGNPVIARLLDQGFQVTGSDISPEMLARAAQHFPQASFMQQATTQISQQATFDGICSFNSLLYLDPIDLLNSIYRMHQALKPGGRLFLYAFDSGPDWRGEPFSYRLAQWMWSSHYGMEEAANLLEEHGYFEVIDTCKVYVDKEEAERLAQELEKQKQKEEEYRRKQEANPSSFPMPLFKDFIERSPYAYVVTARRCER
jgi:SAM-dependent methyltransferase